MKLPFIRHVTNNYATPLIRPTSELCYFRKHANLSRAMFTPAVNDTQL